METLVIGLDAATWSRIDDLVEAGDLPTIEGLLANGVRGDLSSTMPPMTPLAWPSMLTGTNPGKHGLYDFFELDRTTYELSSTDISDLEPPAVWDVFDAEGVDAGFFNIPVAYPPPETSEFFVSGIPSELGQGITDPPELESSLIDDGFEIQPDITAEDGLERYFEAISDHTETQAAVLSSLLTGHDLDHLWTVFMGLDWAQHYLWETTIDGENAVDKLYRQVDRLLGELLAEINDDVTVMLVSDHGARRINGEIHLNSVLDDWGYLERADGEAGGAVPRLRTELIDLGWSIGKSLPREVRKAIKRTVPSETMTDIESTVGVGHEAMTTEIDWPNTTAFAYGYMGRVFVHVTDRYADGPVDGESSDNLTRELAAKLESLTHPETGDPLVEEVLDAKDVYEGPYADDGADLIVVPADWRYMFYGDFGDKWFHSPNKRLVDHDPEGVMLVAGPDQPATEISADITDIAPTLLALHDLPVVDSMDGTVINTVAGSSNTQSVPAELYQENKESSNRSDTEEEEVKNRLSDLGYL